MFHDFSSLFDLNPTESIWSILWLKVQQQKLLQQRADLCKTGSIHAHDTWEHAIKAH